MDTTRTAYTPVVEPRVSIAGGLRNDIIGYARDRIAAAAAHAHEPVLSASVRLTRHPDPAVANPVVALANLDVNGRLVRAQVSAPSAKEAVEALAARLRGQLERVSRNWQARRGAAPTSRPWRAVPADQAVVRRSSFTAARSTVDDAAAELDAMDYDFHLFTEAGSGQPSVIYRAGPTGYRVAQLRPAPERIAAHSVPLTVSPIAAVAMPTATAVDQLAGSERDFLFYRDTDLATAALLYRRFDGAYGLLTPPA